MQPPHMALPQISLTLPQDLVDKIMNTQHAVVNKKTTQANLNDARSLREFLQFCEGHGIKSSKAFPAKEDLLVAWAGSFAGRLAGNTVSAKLGAIRREHKRRGLVWQGGVLLQRILQGVEELRPVSRLKSKREPSTSMLENSNGGLTTAGDVKPAAPKSESDDSSQSDDNDDDVIAEPAIIVDDSSESDSDVDVAVAVSAVKGSNKRKTTDGAQPQAKKAKLNGDAPEDLKTIFIKRLSWSVDNERLAQEFAHCGEVESATVPIDRNSGKSRGFGYVRFTTSEAVEKALLIMNGKEIDGRAIVIERSTIPDKSQQPSPPSSTLFVGNLGELSEDKIRNYFKDYSVKSVRLPTDHDTGRPKGFGFVVFEDVDGAKKAFEEKNGADIEGRTIRLDYDRGRGAFQVGGRGNGRGRGASGCMSESNLKNSGIATFEGKKIIFEFTIEDKKFT